METIFCCILAIVMLLTALEIGFRFLGKKGLVPKYALKMVKAVFRGFFHLIEATARGLKKIFR
ncbi:hypothetical protein KJ969_05045 [Patescibacteria group bacterium]|nr:hypothetical protein [Patescibacteria group bacterium]MBU1922280.1 hypothetical protein [Patescibacteria group bacterium]